MNDQHTRGMATTRHRSLVWKGKERLLWETKAYHKVKKCQQIEISTLKKVWANKASGKATRLFLTKYWMQHQSKLRLCCSFTNVTRLVEVCAFYSSFFCHTWCLVMREVCYRVSAIVGCQNSKCQLWVKKDCSNFQIPAHVLSCTRSPHEHCKMQQCVAVWPPMHPQMSTTCDCSCQRMVPGNKRAHRLYPSSLLQRRSQN